MTPREVDELSSVELAAFWRLMEAEAREQQRQARRQARGR